MAVENRVPRGKPILIFIVGPTATGKSEFAIEAASRFGGEILNTDSVQVYSRVDIGTAKPSPEQMAVVPHHLFSFVPAGATFTAGEFRRHALDVIASRFKSGIDIFFAVGGSGFYVQALEKGMYPVPEVPVAIRAAVESDFATYGSEAMFAELQDRDPDYAAEISGNDTYRIKRALEIVRTLQGPENPKSTPPSDAALTWSGIRKRFEAESRSASGQRFDIVKIGVTRPRDAIRRSVEERTRRMLQHGLIDEVRSLRDQGLSAWAPMLSVGYRETQGFLDGRITRVELETAIVTSTMQLAKRQSTWFRRDPEIHWFDSGAGWSEPLRFLEDRIRTLQA